MRLYTIMHICSREMFLNLPNIKLLSNKCRQFFQSFRSPLWTFMILLFKTETPFIPPDLWHQSCHKLFFDPPLLRAKMQSQFVAEPSMSFFPQFSSTLLPVLYYLMIQRFSTIHSFETPSKQKVQSGCKVHLGT
jgi:hypothetical protein